MGSGGGDPHTNGPRTQRDTLMRTHKASRITGEGVLKLARSTA
jgi:hypothetical protein